MDGPCSAISVAGRGHRQPLTPLTHSVAARRAALPWAGQFHRFRRFLQDCPRYYDPVLLRWLTQDPLGFDAGDSNLYRYVRNDPTRGIDPSGERIVILVTHLPSGLKGHGQIWVVNKDCTEAYTYDATGPGRFRGLVQIVLSAQAYFIDDWQAKPNGPFADAQERFDKAGERFVSVISDGDYKAEKLALDLASKSTRQIPLYNSTFLNSNSWARAMLDNAGKYIKLDYSKVDLVGWNYDKTWGYGGAYFDKTGNPTKKLFDLLNQAIASNPAPFEPDKQRFKEGAIKLKMVLDGRAKNPTPPLPTPEDFKKMLDG